MPPPEEGVLAPYVDAIRAHVVLVSIVALAAFLAAVVWTWQRAPAYEARAELLVTPYPSGQVSLLGLSLLSQGNEPTRTIQTAAALGDSNDDAAAAAAQLGEGWTAKRVRKATDVTPLGETNILAVTAKATSASRAASIANAFTRAAIEVRSKALRRQAAAAIPGVERELETLRPQTPAADDLQRQLTLLRQISTGKDPTLSMSELAVPPAAPTGAPRWLIVALAALAGLILGIGAALLSETLARDLIRSEDQLLRLFPLPVLARIPNPSSWRSRQGLPQVPTTVREAFRTVQLQLDMRGGERRAVMLVSSSPEEGKTSSRA
jgi:capsular polysaccharide biosynthesis protein